MKNVTLNFTAEDLDNDMGSIYRCAGYLASKRSLPQTNCFAGTFGGPCIKTGVEGENEDGTLFRIPKEATYKLSDHATWVWTKGCAGKKAEPFSCVIQVPDHIEVVE